MHRQVVVSAPSENKSGTGSDSATPTPLTEPCEFNTCPTGSPAEGFNASDRECSSQSLISEELTWSWLHFIARLNYVNSFPCDPRTCYSF